MAQLHDCRQQQSDIVWDVEIHIAERKTFIRTHQKYQQILLIKPRILYTRMVITEFITITQPITLITDISRNFSPSLLSLSGQTQVLKRLKTDIFE